MSALVNLAQVDAPLAAVAIPGLLTDPGALKPIVDWESLPHGVLRVPGVLEPDECAALLEVMETPTFCEYRRGHKAVFWAGPDLLTTLSVRLSMTFGQLRSSASPCALTDVSWNRSTLELNPCVRVSRLAAFPIHRDNFYTEFAPKDVTALSAVSTYSVVILLEQPEEGSEPGVSLYPLPADHVPSAAGLSIDEELQETTCAKVFVPYGGVGTALLIPQHLLHASAPESLPRTLLRTDVIVRAASPVPVAWDTDAYKVAARLFRAAELFDGSRDPETASILYQRSMHIRLFHRVAKIADAAMAAAAAAVPSICPHVAEFPSLSLRRRTSSHYKFHHTENVKDPRVAARLVAATTHAMLKTRLTAVFAREDDGLKQIPRAVTVYEDGDTCSDFSDECEERSDYAIDGCFGDEDPAHPSHPEDGKDYPFDVEGAVLRAFHGRLPVDVDDDESPSPSSFSAFVVEVPEVEVEYKLSGCYFGARCDYHSREDHTASFKKRLWSAERATIVPLSTATDIMDGKNPTYDVVATSIQPYPWKVCGHVCVNDVLRPFFHHAACQGSFEVADCRVIGHTQRFVQFGVTFALTETRLKIYAMPVIAM